MLRNRIAIAGILLGATRTMGSEGGAGGNALISPNPGLMIWTTVTFVVLLLILRKWAWKPLLGAVEAREKSIRDSLDGARRDREEAQRLLAEHRSLVSQAARERAEAVESGRRDAEQVKESILEEARKQKDQLLQQADAQIQAAVREARGHLKTTAADLAVQAAGMLLTRNLDESSQRKLVEDYLADLDRLPPGTSTLSS